MIGVVVIYLFIRRGFEMHYSSDDSGPPQPFDVGVAEFQHLLEDSVRVRAERRRGRAHPVGGAAEPHRGADLLDLPQGGVLHGPLHLVVDDLSDI